MTGIEMFAKQFMKLLGITPEAAQDSFARINALPGFVAERAANFDQRLAEIEMTQQLICEKLGITRPLMLNHGTQLENVNGQ